MNVRFDKVSWTLVVENVFDNSSKFIQVPSKKEGLRRIKEFSHKYRIHLRRNGEPVTK